MVRPIRNRLACDRCHGQKLRCPRDTASGVCSRCAKAGAACIFSPRGQTASHQTGPPGTVSVDDPAARPVENAHPELVDGMALDWPFMYDGLSLDNLLGVMTPGSSEPLRSEGFGDGPGRVDDEPRNEPNHTVDGAEKPKSHFQELSAVSAEMDRLFAAMPPDEFLHLSRGQAMHIISAQMAEIFDQKDLLEKTFGALQRLVDLYPDVVKTCLSLKREPQKPCEEPDCVHHSVVPQVLAPIVERVEAESSRRRVDVALANLLLACHTRVLDLLETALMHSVSCFRLTLASPDLTELDFHAPDLKIGSFVPPKASSAQLQAFLLKHLLSSLGERSRHFLDTIASLPGGQSDRRIRCLVVQVELLQERHDGILRECEGLAPAILELEEMKQAQLG